MLILIHVLVALSSITHATYLIVRPSKRGLSANYVLVALTLFSGTYLVISTHAHLLQACTTGILYLSAVMGCQVFAHTRLSRT
jgi:hypothetical protein